MQYVVKIYQGQGASAPLAQISEIIDLSISDDVNGISSCSIALEANVPGIAQYRKVEVCEVGEISDTRVFLGYVDSFVPAFDRITLSCKSEKGLLARKLVTVDRTFSNKTVTEILTQLFADWNGAYSEDWAVSTSIATTTTKTVKVGDNLYDIIEELATSAEAVWDSQDRVVRVAALLGTDHTQPSDFKELVYNGENARENTLNSVSYESYGTLSNVIIGDDGTSKNTQSDSASIAEFGALAELASFRPGSLANDVAKYLAAKKGGQFAYRIVPDGMKFEASVGDKVRLRIENVSSYFDFEGDVIVNTKKTRIVNGSKICEYEVSDKYVYFDSFAKRFLAVESDVALNLVR